MTPGSSGTKMSPKVLSMLLTLLCFWFALTAALLACQSFLVSVSPAAGMPMLRQMSAHLRHLPGPTTISM